MRIYHRWTEMRWVGGHYRLKVEAIDSSQRSQRRKECGRAAGCPDAHQERAHGSPGGSGTMSPPFGLPAQKPGPNGTLFSFGPPFGLGAVCPPLFTQCSYKQSTLQGSLLGLPPSRCPPRSLLGFGFS